MRSQSGPKELQKFYWVFRLIRLLSAPPYYTVKQLATMLDVSEKTIYNYLDLLESLDFQIDKNRHHQYYLHIEQNRRGDAPFDPEEASYLQELLWAAPDSDPRRNQLLLWLNRQYDLAPVVENLTRYTPAAHRERLREALEEGRRVRLRNYRNASGAIADRYLEPIAFQNDYQYLWAQDLDKGEPRQYRLSRIGYVEVLTEPITGDYSHVRPDLFGWTTGEWKYLQLLLSAQAEQLLREEYPAAKAHLSAARGGRCLLDVHVHGFEAIGRWVLGLCDQIEVLDTGDGVAFRGYLRGKWGEGG